MHKAVQITSMTIADLWSQLQASIGIYKNTCYELLGPLNLPDSQMIALLDERQAEAWSDADLQTALKVRLGDNYEIYASLQSHLNKRIQVFCKKLSLGNNGKPPWIESDGTLDEKACRKFFKSFRLRTRGGFNTEKYGTLLAAIDRDIDKLSKLASGSTQLEPVKVERINKFQSEYWQNIRDQAERLFDSLSSRFLPCARTHPHQANLRLEIRKDRAAEGDATKFTFLLTFEKHSHLVSAPPWDWRDVEIRSYQLAETASAVTTPTDQAPRKIAHFVPSITVSSSSRPPIACSPISELAANIDSLCRALVTTPQRDCCLGVLEDKAWQHHVYSVIGPASKAQISEAVSLNDIIYGARGIAPRQKCMLALILASSVLQLYDTPWLPRAWKMENIFFLKNHGGHPIPSQFYVSQTFKSPQDAATDKGRGLIKNDMVFALGVALLELSYGANILAFKEPRDLSDDVTEFSIANRLARELNNYESENYARAVLRCITCTFDTFAFDFNDREFREAFYQAVVVPLQDDYMHVTGGKPIQYDS